eukprot:1530919-Prymnesium_polylepis.1
MRGTGFLLGGDDNRRADHRQDLHVTRRYVRARPTGGAPRATSQRTPPSRGPTGCSRRSRSTS